MSYWCFLIRLFKSEVYSTKSMFIFNVKTTDRILARFYLRNFFHATTNENMNFEMAINQIYTPSETELNSSHSARFETPGVDSDQRTDQANDSDQMTDSDYENFFKSPLLTKYKIIDKNCQTISEFTYLYFMFAENAKSNRKRRYFPCTAALLFLLTAIAFTAVFVTVIQRHNKLNAALKIMDADQLSVIFITGSIVTTVVILALFLFALGKNRILQYDNNELCRKCFLLLSSYQFIATIFYLIIFLNSFG